ncbi:unnamed protein product, partial [Meganyctiphanes norvegica]
MPVRGNTFKIFCGNLSDDATSQELRELFEQYGTVVEADVVKNFGFVHMEKSKESKDAIEALNKYELHGRAMAVEASTGTRRGGNQKTKIFVGNLHKDTKLQELRDLFEEYGAVQEADILTNFAFVHMTMENEAHEAIRELDGFELHGLRLRVQQSTSVVRKRPGMGDSDACFRCGSSGHWSKECPRDAPRDMRGGPRFADRGERRFGGRFDPYPPPPPPGYMRERMMRSYHDDPYDRYDRLERPGNRSIDSIYERRPGSRMLDDIYERRPAPPLPPAYLDYGRRSPQPRYPPPPPTIRGSFCC